MKKLQEWQSAGLLDKTQVQAIARYEDEQPRASHLLWHYGLLGLGVLAVALGIAAIVAANWDAIPAMAKITVHGAVNLLAAATLVHFYRRGLEKTWGFEAGVFLKAFLVLTLIALTGQVLQIQSSFAAALTLWWGLTAPLLLVLGSRLPSLLLLLGLTLFVLFDNFFSESSFLHRHTAIGKELAFFCLALLPALLTLSANAPFWQRIKPLWAKHGAVFGVAISALLIQLLFFTHATSRHYMQGFTLPLVCATGVLILLLIRRRSAGKAILPLDLFMLFQAAIALTALFVPGLLVFIVYWLAVGIIGVYHDRRSWVVPAVTALALRLISFFLDLFDNMMLNGALMIALGLGVIALIRNMPYLRILLLRLLEKTP